MQKETKKCSCYLLHIKEKLTESYKIVGRSCHSSDLWDERIIPEIIASKIHLLLTNGIDVCKRWIWDKKKFSVKFFWWDEMAVCDFMRKSGTKLWKKHQCNNSRAIRLSFEFVIRFNNWLHEKVTVVFRHIRSGRRCQKSPSEISHSIYY